MWQGVAVGLLVSLLFSLVPLLEVRLVKPLLLIRGGTGGGSTSFQAAWWTPAGLRARAAALDRVQALAAVLVTAALVAVASWQAASLRVGLYVCGGFAGIALVLHLVSSAVVRAVRPIARAKWFPLRHAVLSLGRPGNQTRVILLAVGIGSFFVIGVRSLQANLLQQFKLELGSSGADMFLIEILPSQVSDVRAFLDARKASDAAEPRLIPVLRARVTGVRGHATSLDTYEDVRRQGPLSREFTITYRDSLEANEKVVGGTFWTTPTPPGAMAEVSVERGLHERAHVDVGDVMRFDILGRTVEARVSSIRNVEWEDARSGGFMFVFRPGPLDKAPQTYIGILKAPPDPFARGRFQRDLVAKFPNVSAIDVREVLATVQQAVGNVTLAISIVGAVALVSGDPHPGWRGGDDQVPARLRGGHPAHAWRQHARAGGDAGARIWRPGAAIRPGRRRGSHRAHLGRVPPRLRHPVAPGPRAGRDRRAGHDASRRHRRGHVQLRRPAPEAARHAARRIAASDSDKIVV